MKSQVCFYFFVLIISLQSCIKDDFVNDNVEPEIRLTSIVDTLALNSELQLEFSFFNNIGRQEDVLVDWESSNPDIISITQDGIVNALALGESVISVSYQDSSGTYSDEMNIVVGESTSVVTTTKRGNIMPSSFYELEGGFELEENGSDLILSFDDSYRASTALPGLFVYLSNNRNSIADALEISGVDVFSGAHSYDIEDVGINDFKYVLYFCKPFNVKVGDGEIVE